VGPGRGGHGSGQARSDRRIDPAPPARAFIDILLGMDSRPLGSGPDDRSAPGQGGPGQGGPQAPAPSRPLNGAIPPGFAARVNLIIPATTVLDLADRPGELGGIGPIDPDPGANTSNRYQN